MVAGLQQCRFVTIARVKPVTGDEVRLVERYKALRQSYKDSIQSLKALLPIRLETAVDDMNAMVPALCTGHGNLSPDLSAEKDRRVHAGL